MSLSFYCQTFSKLYYRSHPHQSRLVYRCILSRPFLVTIMLSDKVEAGVIRAWNTYCRVTLHLQCKLWLKTLISHILTRKLQVIFLSLEQLTPYLVSRSCKYWKWINIKSPSGHTYVFLFLMWKFYLCSTQCFIKNSL